MRLFLLRDTANAPISLSSRAAYCASCRKTSPRPWMATSCPMSEAWARQRTKWVRSGKRCSLLIFTPGDHVGDLDCSNVARLGVTATLTHSSIGGSSKYLLFFRSHCPRMHLISHRSLAPDDFDLSSIVIIGYHARRVALAGM